MFNAKSLACIGFNISQFGNSVKLKHVHTTIRERLGTYVCVVCLLRNHRITESYNRKGRRGIQMRGGKSPQSRIRFGSLPNRTESTESALFLQTQGATRLYVTTE